MKIKVLNIGKTKAPYLIAGEEEYKKRLTHYISCEWVILPDVSAKGMSRELIKEKEAQWDEIKKEILGEYFTNLNQVQEEADEE